MERRIPKPEVKLKLGWFGLEYSDGSLATSPFGTLLLYPNAGEAWAKIDLGGFYGSCRPVLVEIKKCPTKI